MTKTRISTHGNIEYGGSGFNNILGGRQNAVTGWTNQMQQQAAQEAAAREQLGQSNRWAGQEGYSPINLLQAQTDPYMASTMGLGGVQWGDNGPMFTQPAPGGQGPDLAGLDWNTGA